MITRPFPCILSLLISFGTWDTGEKKRKRERECTLLWFSWSSCVFFFFLSSCLLVLIFSTPIFASLTSSSCLYDCVSLFPLLFLPDTKKAARRRMDEGNEHKREERLCFSRKRTEAERRRWRAKQATLISFVDIEREGKVTGSRERN